jgi:hypothetical protein
LIHNPFKAGKIKEDNLAISKELAIYSFVFVDQQHTEVTCIDKTSPSHVVLTTK